MPDDSDQYDVSLDGFPSTSDPEGLRARLPIEIIASQFVDEMRQGRQPSIDEIVRRYPRLADEIREFFPMLLSMEKWKSDAQAAALKRQMPADFNIVQLGECRIVREIGRGGMGVVFEAIRHGQRVAVKLLPWRSTAVPRWLEQFEHETGVAARLRHHNIVPILGCGEHGDYCYYIMQFVDGVSLDRVIQRLSKTEGIVYADEIRQTGPGDGQHAGGRASRPVSSNAGRSLAPDSWMKFARIALQAGNALRYAHRSGVVHNDVKPENLLLDADGRVWMTDFGLAGSTDDAPDSGSDGIPDRLTGTLRYMAPERFRGVSDIRSDVYSLGMTLYELITLAPAFDEPDSGRLVELITTTRAPAPRSINPAIPGDLETIVLKAGEPNPDHRYATAEAMVSDLLRFLKNRPVSGSGPGRLNRFARLFHRGSRKL